MLYALIIFQILILFIEFIVVLVGAMILTSGFVSSIYGAPYVPISRKLMEGLLSFGGLSPHDVFYDLGSGDGRVIRTAIYEFGVTKAIGYEIAFWPYLVSRFSCRKLVKNKTITINRANIFAADLSSATFIYMYLFPELVQRLAVKISKECHSGTKILCPSFSIDTTKHQRIQLLKTEKIGTMTAYLYQVV